MEEKDPLSQGLDSPGPFSDPGLKADRWNNTPATEYPAVTPAELDPGLGSTDFRDNENGPGTFL